MSTKNNSIAIHLVKVISDFSRFFDKETCSYWKKNGADTILILPDFKIKYKKTPFKFRSEEELKEDGGIIEYGGEYGDEDFVIKNERSFSKSNFWDEIETAHYPEDLFKGKLKAVTTLNTSEFKDIFIKKCEKYVETNWRYGYNDCMSGDYGTLNNGVKDKYIKNDREFFYPKITLEII